MTLYPFMNLFSLTLFMSTILALSSNYWVTIWMALELNMISFIPIMASYEWAQEHEASLKYLMFQALGSSLLLLFSFNTQMTSLITLALIIKLGAAPFHFWFPSVMNSISWPSATILMTWQKLAPMLLMLSLFHQEGLLTVLGLISAITGGLGGINQTNLRPLLAYSSIGHMGWMIAGMAVSPFSAAIYFMIYLIMTTSVMLIALFSNISSLKKSASPFLFNHQQLIALNMISLAGLPPFSGFIPKLIILISMKSMLTPLILILSSLMNLLYYLNFILTSFLSLNMMKKSKSSAPTPFLLSLNTWLAVSPLPIMFLFVCMI